MPRLIRRYQIQISESAKKALARLREGNFDLAFQISAKIDELRTNPRPANAEKLETATELWRVRVRTFRIVYEIHDDRILVEVVEVAHRREVYRDL